MSENGTHADIQYFLPNYGFQRTADINAGEKLTYPVAEIRPNWLAGRSRLRGSAEISQITNAPGLECVLNLSLFLVG